MSRREEDGPQPDEIVVRPLGFDDLAAVQRIEDSSYSMPWSRTTFRNLMSRMDTDLLGAFERDLLVGFAVIWYVVDQAELGNVAVDERYRRQGIGSQLVGRVLERARERGAAEIFLEVRRSNTAAQRLYRQHGFRQVGLRRGYYARPAEDALVMRNGLPEVERLS